MLRRDHAVQPLPLRMLKEGTLPHGYTVKKRKLVKVTVKKDAKKSGKRAA